MSIHANLFEKTLVGNLGCSWKIYRVNCTISKVYNSSNVKNLNPNKLYKSRLRNCHLFAKLGTYLANGFNPSRSAVSEEVKTTAEAPR